jgi:rhamnose transport system permease protein
MWRWMTAPETYSAALLAAGFAVCAATVPRFLDSGYLFDRSSLYIETGLVALAMTFVIVGGHIDLSAGAMLALCGCVGAGLVGNGVPAVPAAVLVLLLGCALGFVNGLLVARCRLPSLVVTLATMAVYRGAAQVLVGDHSLSVPEHLAGVDRCNVAGTPAPAPLVILIGTAVVLGLVLHRTVFGRRIVAMGTNADAARYAGVPVSRTTVAVFVMSGAIAAVGSMLMVSRVAVARYDHALGMELSAITAVVLGGASIFGGRGTVFGTVLAIALIACLQTGMGVANVKAEYQQTASGALLIVAVLLSNIAGRLRQPEGKA